MYKNNTVKLISWKLFVLFVFCSILGSKNTFAQNFSHSYKLVDTNRQKMLESEFKKFFKTELETINNLSPQNNVYFIDKSITNAINFRKKYRSFKNTTNNSDVDKLGNLLVEYSSLFENEHEKKDKLRLLINDSSLELQSIKEDSTKYILLGYNTRNSLLLLSLISNYLETTKLPNVVERTIVLAELKKIIELYTKRTYCFYDYPSSKRSAIKFVNIRTGNDIFIPGQVKVGGYNVLRKNYDMAYTGSLLFELGTDMLKISKAAYTKQYQTLFVGLDVHTPYFRDTTIFKNDSAYNANDYPHGNFFYLGRSVYKLHRSGLYRDRFTIKTGKIGGNAGKIFQETIHFDVSKSPPTSGWGAQIANGGRLGLQFEYEGENMLYGRNHLIFLNSKQGINYGSYQSNLYLGLNISNKPFNFTNQHQVCNKGRFYSWKSNFYYSAGLSYKYNIHNSMLEGFGWRKTFDNDALSSFPNNDKTSVYTLTPDKVVRNIFEFNLKMAYTFKSLTFLYNFYSRSPEAKFDASKFPLVNGNGAPVNINGWFQWGEIGVVIHNFSR